MKLFFILLLSLLTMYTSAYATNYYVSKTGNDTNTGTSSAPFLTINKAALTAMPGDIVYIGDGIYRETVATPRDGTSAAPITFKAVNKNKVTISATEIVTNWTVYSGSIYKASATMALGDVLNMLYYNGVAMDMARWPNNTDNNRFTIDAVPVTGGSASNITASNIPAIDWTGGTWVHTLEPVGQELLPLQQPPTLLLQL